MPSDLPHRRPEARQNLRHEHAGVRRLTRPSFHGVLMSPILLAPQLRGLPAMPRVSLFGFQSAENLSGVLPSLSRLFLTFVLSAAFAEPVTAVWQIVSAIAARRRQGQSPSGPPALSVRLSCLTASQMMRASPRCSAGYRHRRGIWFGSSSAVYVYSARRRVRAGRSTAKAFPIVASGVRVVASARETRGYDEQRLATRLTPARRRSTSSMEDRAESVAADLFAVRCAA
jgi:hypothetical protein